MILRLLKSDVQDILTSSKNDNWNSQDLGASFSSLRSVHQNVNSHHSQPHHVKLDLNCFGQKITKEKE
jgi:hypothetical protein